jgi:hypothetical protein
MCLSPEAHGTGVITIGEPFARGLLVNFSSSGSLYSSGTYLQLPSRTFTHFISQKNRLHFWFSGCPIKSGELK